MATFGQVPDPCRDIKARVLQIVVEHVQTQFDELTEATKEIPGFHQDILPKFDAYVSQLRAKSKELTCPAIETNSSTSPLRGVTASITSLTNSLTFSELRVGLRTDELETRCVEGAEKNLETFVRKLEEKGNSCGGDLTQTLKKLKVLQHHITLVELSKQLKQWTNENDQKFSNQDKSIRMAQTQLASDIATLVKASEVDVKKVNVKLMSKVTDTALSPPTFKETPSPPRLEASSASRRDRPSVPALWAAEVQSVAEKFPPTNVPSRVTLERRPFRINIFDDEDEDDREKRVVNEKEPSVVMKPKAPGHLLSSQLTFRQKVTKVASPRFGKSEAKGRKPPSNSNIAVKKIAKANPPRRLSLGTKMARRSISTNAWSDD